MSSAITTVNSGNATGSNAFPAQSSANSGGQAITTTNNNKDKEKEQKDGGNGNGQNIKTGLKKKKSSTGSATAGNTSVPCNSKVYFLSSECKYSVILDRVKELDWKLVEGEKYESRVNLIWVDVASIHEHFR